MTQPVPVVIHSIDPCFTAVKAPWAEFWSFLWSFNFAARGANHPYNIDRRMFIFKYNNKIAVFKLQSVIFIGFRNNIASKQYSNILRQVRSIISIFENGHERICINVATFSSRQHYIVNCHSHTFT